MIVTTLAKEGLAPQASCIDLHRLLRQSRYHKALHSCSCKASTIRHSFYAIDAYNECNVQKKSRQTHGEQFLRAAAHLALHSEAGDECLRRDLDGAHFGFCGGAEVRVGEEGHAALQHNVVVTGRLTVHTHVGQHRGGAPQPDRLQGQLLLHRARRPVNGLWSRALFKPNLLLQKLCHQTIPS